MMHALFRPRPPLDRLIESLWVTDAYAAPTSRQRVLPNGSHALILHLGEQPVQLYEHDDAGGVPLDASAIVCGARDAPLVIGTALGPTVGVIFRPGGAYPFFAVPASALTDANVALGALWGDEVPRLRERVLAAPTARDRIRLVEDALLAHARRSLAISPVLAAAMRAFDEPELTRVAEVNRRTGFSPKRLAALFTEHVGLRPKTYWRVRRFRAALREIDRGSLRGAAIAHEHGYCDQAHFLREFRALAGSTPREYLAGRIAGTGHVSVYR